ncbi:hypothetical protein SNL152K_10586 [Streptomyces sp. NL15-2K]|nr:hypothetical protein SNL152K_10586 [Streptomyces sp. NL15-2K]
MGPVANFLITRLTVAEISRGVPDIKAAILHAGAARVPAKFFGHGIAQYTEGVLPVPGR